MDFHEEDDDIIRSSCSQMFLKKGVLKKFAIFTEKRLRWNLFLIKLLGFRPATLFKKKTPRQVFSCLHIVKILSTPFFLQKTSGGCFFIILLLLVASVILHASNFLTWPVLFTLTYFSIYYSHLLSTIF